MSLDTEIYQKKYREKKWLIKLFLSYLQFKIKFTENFLPYRLISAIILIIIKNMIPNFDDILIT